MSRNTCTAWSGWHHSHTPRAKDIRSACYLSALTTCLASWIVLTLTSCSGSERSDVATTQGNMKAIRAACAAYKADCGSLPPEATGLKALIDSPGISEWQGPYLRGEIPRDSWGNEFKYRIANGNPVIESAGPDGKFGTPDDMTAGTTKR